MVIGYSQCIPGSSNPTPTSNPPTGTNPAPSSTGLCGGASRTKFTYFGVNESGAEFGQTKIPVGLVFIKTFHFNVNNVLYRVCSALTTPGLAPALSTTSSPRDSTPSVFPSCLSALLLSPLE